MFATRYSFAALALVFICHMGWGAKTAEEYWSEIDLPLAVVKKDVETNNCYQSELHFVAGATALDAAAGLEKLKLVPHFVVSPKVEKIFAGMLLITPKDNTKKKESVSELYAQLRAERKTTYDNWAKLYNEKSVRVDFEEILDWVEGSKSYEKNSAYTTSVVYNAYLSVIKDPHTAITPKKHMDDMMSGNASKFVGIGARMRVIEDGEEKTIVVEEPLEGSPALKAGLRPHDVLTHIDGLSVAGKSLSDAVKMIRGEAGTDVILTILRGEETLQITVTRGVINVANVSSKVLTETGKKLGYIKLNDFMEKTGCDEVRTELRSLERQRVDGLILDLRNNGGGLITQATCMGDLFLAKGKGIVAVKSFNPLLQPTTYFATAPRYTDLPMVTLINHRSASASEILAGALQDNFRSLVVGTRSFGKGSVQNLQQIGNDIYFKYTTARFYLPSGRTNQILGIIPDMEAYVKPNPTEDDKAAFREEDEYTALPSLGAKWVQPRPELMKELGRCVDKLGKANHRFENSSAVTPDYQQYYSEDVLNCAVALQRSNSNGTEIGNGWDYSQN